MIHGVVGTYDEEAWAIEPGQVRPAPLRGVTEVMVGQVYGHATNPKSLQTVLSIDTTGMWIRSERPGQPRTEDVHDHEDVVRAISEGWWVLRKAGP